MSTVHHLQSVCVALRSVKGTWDSNQQISLPNSGMKDLKIWLARFVWRTVMMTMKSWLFVTNVIRDFIFTVSNHPYYRFLRNLSFVSLVRPKKSNKSIVWKKSRFKGWGILKCWFWKMKHVAERKNRQMIQYHQLTKTTIEYLVSWKNNKRKSLVNYWARKSTKTTYKLRNKI